MNYDIKITGEVQNHGQNYSEPGKADKYFAKTPQALTAQQQIDFQLKERKSLNPFASLIGKWPGEESWEEVINELD